MMNSLARTKLSAPMLSELSTMNVRSIAAHLHSGDANNHRGRQRPRRAGDTCDHVEDFRLTTAGCRDQETTRGTKQRHIFRFWRHVWLIGLRVERSKVLARTTSVSVSVQLTAELHDDIQNFTFLKAEGGSSMLQHDNALFNRTTELCVDETVSSSSKIKQRKCFGFFQEIECVAFD